MIEQLITALRRGNITLDGEEIADLLWLATQLEGAQVIPAAEFDDREQRAGSRPPIDQGDSRRDSSSQDSDADAGEDRSPSDGLSEDVPLYSDDAASDSSALEGAEDTGEESDSSKSLPFKTPAAPALRNQLALSRALRPLMRKVKSQRELLLDEEATAICIAEGGPVAPVMQPALERWLDLDLVIEVSPSTAIWHETILDFQRLLEHQGAFRYMRTWCLQADSETGVLNLFLGGLNLLETGQKPRSPQELRGSTVRRLLLLVSDALSPQWQQREVGIFSLLKQWSEDSPVAMVQLLPTRLWRQSALGGAFPAQLGTQEPGVTNDQLIPWHLPVWAFESPGLEDALHLPVVTLSPALMSRWASVVAGSGAVLSSGIMLTSDLLERQIRRTHEKPILDSSEAKVKRFFSVASPLAQRLVKLMAVVPVNMPVIYLLQQTLLPESEQEHIAEIFMGGLLEARRAHCDDDTESKTLEAVMGDQESVPEFMHYDFAPGVREVLLDRVTKSDARMVLETLSQYIASKLNRSVKNFMALLSPDMQWDSDERQVMLPFARVAKQVLRRMGGEYAAFAETIDGGGGAPSPIQLRPLEFETAQLVEISEPAQPEEFPGIPALQTETVEVATVLLEPALDASQLADNWQTITYEVATLERQRRGRQWQVRRETQQGRVFVEHLGDDVQLEMMPIPAGRFMMGSPRDELERLSDEGPQHEVNVSAFWMGRYAVTQAQWRFVAGLERVNRDLKADPSRFKGDKRPVERVSWLDAVEFCDRLSAYTGRIYCLPSEAQWEYACRAGTGTPFHFGETITTEIANYDGNYIYGDGPKGDYRRKTTDVDHFGIANEFGLCEMHGNVWEWCLDHWHNDYDGAPGDGSAWLTDNEDARRVLRGGSWVINPESCRSAYRDSVDPGGIIRYFGFRVVCSPQ